MAGSTVFYPSDAVSTERAIELAANTKGVCYIRTSRPDTAVIYANEEAFAAGQCKVVGEVSAADVCTVVGGGVTLHEALKVKARGCSQRISGNLHFWRKTQVAIMQNIINVNYCQ